MEDSKEIKVHTNGGLMKHTKAQLCEIILRKDDVEKQLREDNKTLLETLEQTNNNLSGWKDLANKATKDFNEMIEICQEMRIIYKANQNECTTKFLNIVKNVNYLNISFIISFALNIILLGYIIYKVLC